MRHVTQTRSGRGLYSALEPRQGAVYQNRLGSGAVVKAFGREQFMSSRFVAVALAIAFFIPLVIMISVGYLGLQEMKRLQNDARGIATGQWIDVELAQQALDYSNQNMLLNQQIVMSSPGQDTLLFIAQRKKNSDQITAIVQQLEARAGSSQEHALLNEVKTRRGKYLTTYKNITDPALVRKTPYLARELLLTDATPLFDDYHRAWQTFAQFQTNEMNQTLQISAGKLTAVKRRAEFMVGLAVLLSIAIAGIVIGTIVTQMRMRAKAEQEIRRMNQDLESLVGQRTAALNDSCKKLVAEVADRLKAENDLKSKTAFLEAEVNSTVDGILVVDTQGQIILRNRRFLELFKIPLALAEETDDRPLLQYVTPQIKNPEQFLEKVQYLYSHPDQISRDEIEHKNGMVVDRYSSPVIGKEGEYYGRIWAFRDITERKRTEDTLRQLSSAVEQSPVLIIITDPQGKISYVNRKFTECTGYAMEEVLGCKPSILKSGHTSPDAYKQLWQTISSGKEWRGEFLNRKKNGELYWESAVIRPIKNELGAISHFIAVKEDITQQKTLETQLRQAQKLEAIGQLAAGIAHEINTPAQYVGDNTTFLKESWAEIMPLLSSVQKVCRATEEGTALQPLLDELQHCWKATDIDFAQSEIPKAIDQSLDGIQRVTKIVRAMKEFSHPGSEEKQAIDLNKAILTTVTVARNEWKYVAEVETCLESDLPPVLCHAGELNQVILNLLVNSAHAIADVVGAGSARKGKIIIRTKRTGHIVEVAISDTGGGIPPEAQPRIFEPFFTTKPVGKGTGQGLALAHNTIVKRHGGRIWFETEVDKGTTFFIQLPLACISAEVPC